MTFLAENAILSAAIELMELASEPFDSDQEINFLHNVFQRTGHLYSDEMEYDAYMNLTLRLVRAGVGRLERWQEERSGHRGGECRRSMNKFRGKGRRVR